MVSETSIFFGSVLLARGPQGRSPFLLARADRVTLPAWREPSS